MDRNGARAACSGSIGVRVHRPPLGEPMSPRKRLVEHLIQCNEGCGLERDASGKLLEKPNGRPIEKFCAVGAELDRKHRGAPKEADEAEATA